MAFTLSSSGLAFSAGKKEILTDISLELAAGKVHAFVGPNGSGKSTLLQLLAGIHSPSKGDVSLGETPVGKWQRKAFAKELTFLPQNSARPLGLTVRDLVACGRFPHRGMFASLSKEDNQAIDAAIERTQVTHLASTVVDHLSGGEMQRVWLAMVLAQQTPILLLDEPTSYLDVSQQLRLLKIVRQLNLEQSLTVIWVLHDLNQAIQYSDHLWVIHQGRLVANSPASEGLSDALLKDVFGIEAVMIEDDRFDSPIMVPVSEAGPVSEAVPVSEAGPVSETESRSKTVPMAKAL
ncbi:ABC transporter ATP-binding protein [Litoribrevibacter albus]|uniref:ABC transporter n=1 Tax=Litoribrevibacter albus TaxID=1473156 RepID=A0AA37SEY5_9GAMM|nr:ABC transporter ATP-binding protein [Litoribrevibacter albus]GLQ32734.1 ABC transporter [Litoribrevibacter albus]